VPVPLHDPPPPCDLRASSSSSADLARSQRFTRSRGPLVLFRLPAVHAAMTAAAQGYQVVHVQGARIVVSGRMDVVRGQAFGGPAQLAGTVALYDKRPHLPPCAAVVQGAPLVMACAAARSASTIGPAFLRPAFGLGGDAWCTAFVSHADDKRAAP